jgi:2-haloacid dehalogenase
MKIMPHDIKVLAFDVFGTVVDWRSSVIAEGEQLGRAKGLNVDWATFADSWRAIYRPYMDRVGNGQLPWTKLDDLHRQMLEETLPKFGIATLTNDEKDHLNRVWHRLNPWPDSVPGLNV